MALIKTVSQEEAEGPIKQAYDQMSKLAGFIPKPMQMFSASAGIFDIYNQVIQYFQQHPTIGMQLRTSIRFMSAAICQYPYCIDMNKKILTTMAGMTEEQAKQLLEDPEKVEMPEKDKAVLLLVKKALETPEDVQQTDIDSVREYGWSDSDIFDAVYYGAFMVSGGILFNTFKMGI